MRQHTIAGFSVIVIAGALALTGCSGVDQGVASGGSQSVAEACQVANDTMEAVGTEVSASMEDLSVGEFGAAVEAFTQLSDGLDETVTKVSNTEVKAVLSDLSGHVGDFADLFDGLDDGDLTGVADRLDDFEAIMTGIQESAVKLEELCGA
ncbi:hypothetical protein [Microbacterium sp. NIBRBAC000506063]|uniref:hypothetical protein n=1 Tax=Microbacterium sp. NIBRBAC000506063 TaxID=2734618 RepID=UPI001BB4F046|nr:hypothetical protein [Microbacterium sp. NIBRBAC000506063]QTV79741.1 hypothetical protein KAE78_13555 [Microbacterium sp. NIBRBAC000506063]